MLRDNQATKARALSLCHAMCLEEVFIDRLLHPRTVIGDGDDNIPSSLLDAHTQHRTLIRSNVEGVHD